MVGDLHHALVKGKAIPARVADIRRKAGEIRQREERRFRRAKMHHRLPDHPHHLRQMRQQHRRPGARGDDHGIRSQGSAVAQHHPPHARIIQQQLPHRHPLTEPHPGRTRCVNEPGQHPPALRPASPCVVIAIDIKRRIPGREARCQGLRIQPLRLMTTLLQLPETVILELA